MSSMEWDDIARRFSAARNWWVGTSSDRGPHSVPVWGVVVGGELMFYGEPGALRSRTLAADPRLVVHLENGDAVLILHGTAQPGVRGVDDQEVIAAYAAKYTAALDLEYLPGTSHTTATVLYVVTPIRVMAWELAASTDWENRYWSADSLAKD